MKKFLFLIFLFFTVNVYAEDICWGINAKVRIFPTSQELETFISALPQPNYVDRFYGVGMAGTVHFNKLCYPVTCGDSFCDAAVETCTNCPFDCGACNNPPESCGNNVCAVTENCADCPHDCGVCPPPPPPPPSCIPQWCDVPLQQCDLPSLSGHDSCGNVCYKPSVQWPNCIPPPVCVPDGTCSAVTPICGQTTTGTDNCGFTCSRYGGICPPAIVFTTITVFEKWLTTTTLEEAPVTKGIRTGTSPNYKYYRVLIEKVIP